MLASSFPSILMSPYLKVCGISFVFGSDLPVVASTNVKELYVRMCHVDCTPRRLALLCQRTMRPRCVSLTVYCVCVSVDCERSTYGTHELSVSTVVLLPCVHLAIAQYIVKDS